MGNYKIDASNRILFSKDMKIVELLDVSCELLSVFLRLDMQLPFGDLSVEELCRRYSLSSEMFLMLCRVYAGADLYLMPSKSEPCGLSQMNAMRYGTVPVVHATGGLRDTVLPCDENGNGGLGFTFQSYNGDDFFAAVKRAIHLYKYNRNGFRALQRRDMEQDFSWDKPAQKYMELFHKMRNS